MERLQLIETFDPKALANLEIESIKYEIQDNQKAKFDCEVKIAQLAFGLSEKTAYRLIVVMRKINNKGLSDEERRNARVEFFQVLNTETGLGFDPYEAALADEKLDLTKKTGNKSLIARDLSEVFSIIYKKPAGVFKECSELLVKFTDEVWESAVSAAMRSPGFYGLGSINRDQIEEHIDFKKLQVISLKRWESLRQAIEN